MLFGVVTAALTAWSCADEDARVRAHLEDALVQLRTLEPPGLSATQRARRAAALTHLRAYIDEGRFPRSTQAAPTPVFVDDADTHCAMGALIAAAGGERIVEHVRRTRNLATVPALSDEPALLAWLDENGLAPEEAALVQPTYFECRPVAPCGGGGWVYDAYLVYAGGVLDDIVVSTPAGSGVCRGDRHTRFYPFEIDWPPGSRIAEPGALALTDSGWVHFHWGRCVHRPALADADRPLINGSQHDCLKTAAARDLRWLTMMCARFGAIAPLDEVQFCSRDGRYQSAKFPALGTMRSTLVTYLTGVGLTAADAGIDLAAYDALERELWGLSDDGGTALDSGVSPIWLWDGGEIAPDFACRVARDAGWPDAGAAPVDAGSMPAADAGTVGPPLPPPSCGCTSGESIALLLGLLCFAGARTR